LTLHRYYKYSIIAFVVLVLLGVPWLINTYPRSTLYIDQAFKYVGDSLATAFLNKAITVTQLHDKYNSASNGISKVRILLVPGHEPNFGGTEYGNLKERDMTVELAGYLKDFFKMNNHYDIVVSRNKIGWNADLQRYFDSNWNHIISFIKVNKSEIK